MSKTAPEQIVTHTPGPWKAELNDGAVYVDAGPDERPICFMQARDTDDDMADQFTSTDKANACLIAAAPEMLDALNGIVGLFQLIDSRHVDGRHNDATTVFEIRQSHRYKAVVAAIDKAEGR